MTRGPDAWGMRVAVALAMAGAFLLPGCLTFEGRFESGFSDAHVQVSPVWRDPGLYDALPEEGTFEGFEVRTIFIPPPPPDNAVPDYPMEVPFEDPDLQDAYGDRQLAVVQWKTGGPAPNQTIELWMGPGLVVQAMVGVDVGDAAKRAAFRTFATTLLDVPGERLKAAEDIFVLNTGGTGGGGVNYPYETQSFEMRYHEASLHGSKVRAAEAFRSMGGLTGFTPHRVVPAGDPIPALRAWTMQQVLYLCEACDRGRGPFYGVVDLVEGNWTFQLRTSMRVVEDGPLRDRQILLVTPDDSAEAVHWSSSQRSDREAARALRAALDRLDREAPDMQDWEFEHGTVEVTEDDPSLRWDDWDECPPQYPPAPGC
jgi:hypothetical protein